MRPPQQQRLGSPVVQQQYGGYRPQFLSQYQQPFVPRQQIQNQPLSFVQQQRQPQLAYQPQQQNQYGNRQNFQPQYGNNRQSFQQQTRQPLQLTAPPNQNQNQGMYPSRLTPNQRRPDQPYGVANHGQSNYRQKVSADQASGIDSPVTAQEAVTDENYPPPPPSEVTDESFHRPDDIYGGQDDYGNEYYYGDEPPDDRGALDSSAFVNFVGIETVCRNCDQSFLSKTKLHKYLRGGCQGHGTSSQTPKVPSNHQTEHPVH
ncbi:MAG: hypothetical protein Q9201_002474 [Fulgogasparrea decipioides]